MERIVEHPILTIPQEEYTFLFNGKPVIGMGDNFRVQVPNVL